MLETYWNRNRAARIDLKKTFLLVDIEAVKLLALSEAKERNSGLSALYPEWGHERERDRRTP